MDKKRSKFFLDKNSSACMILATFVIGFIGTMYLSLVSVGRSYAIPSSGKDLPNSLTINLTSLNLLSDSSVVNFLKAAGVYDLNDGERYGLDAPRNRIHTADNFDLYCLDKDKDIASKSDGNDIVFSKSDAPYGADGSNVSKTVLFLLSEAYKNDNVSSTEYYALQQAIWFAIAYENPSNENKNYRDAMTKAFDSQDPMAVKIVGLYNTAKKKADQYASSGNKINLVGKDDVQLNLSEDGKYLETTDLRVEGTTSDISKMNGFTVDVGGSSAKVVDTNGNEKNIFENGNVFRIRIPVDDQDNASSILANVKISASFDEDSLYYYIPPKSLSNIQNILYVNSVKRSVPVDVSLNFVKVSKQDVTNGEELPGATLQISRLSGDGVYTVIHSFISSDVPKYIFLEPGEYKLTEVSAPDGYELSTEEINFTVGTDNKPVETVVMKNTPYITPPDTASNIPLSVYIFGAIVLICGASIIYLNVRKKNA